MIKVERTKNPKTKPDYSNLSFGKYFSDHMFVMYYDEGKGWHDAAVVENKPQNFDLSMTVFHYSQSIFEGLKAYKNAETGKITLFRPMDNFARMNRSCDRMCMPRFDEKLAYEGLCELLKTDADWIPTAPGTAMYIRPTIIATQDMLGVKASKSYLFYIILSPVASYYAHGLEPVGIYVEEHYVRAVIGGTGDVKCGANYAISLKAGEKAHELGYDQVLWLDGRENKYVEEVGSMNIFFVIDGVVVTPMLTGSILPGITRDSMIKLLKSWNVPVEERRISIDEVAAAAESGKLTECFGSGTAAVVSPVGTLHFRGSDHTVGDGKMGELTSRLYDTLTGIQYGKVSDPFSWVIEL